ncbi:DUF4214 domain-containing protein [Oxalobacteraceae bacterium]|nr:DUF4214 domain-containing protein [Oxalobacteraceae bacterium]
MATTAAQIQALYVAYFNRPADYFSLPAWQTKADALGLAYVANAFSVAKEYTDLYAGKSLADTVNSIYLNLFNRPAEAAGLVHWVNLIQSGQTDIGHVALDILNGAQNADLISVTSKVAAATTFTTSLANSADGIRGYDGDAANAVVKVWLAGVTTEANLATATSAASLAAVTASAVAAHDNVSGTAAVLTTGLDTLTGTAGIDVYSGDDTTLSAADSINAGAGKDILNYTNSTAAVALPGALVNGVETFNVRAVGNAVTAGDLSLYSGLTAFNSDRSNAAITVTNLASGGEFGVIGNGTVTNAGDYNFGYAAAATAAVVNFSNGTKGTADVILTGTGITGTTVHSTGASNVVDALTLAASSNTLTIDAATKLTTGVVTAAGITAAGDLVTLTGAGAIVTDLNAVAGPKLVISGSGARTVGILNNATVTVDGSAATGAITATLGTSTTMKFTGGSGNDVVTAGATLAAGAAVNGGAGTDSIEFTANGQLDATSGALYTNFESLTATAVTDIDMDNIAGIVSISTSGASTFVNLTAAQAAAVTVTGAATLDFGVKDAAAVGHLDVLTITASADDAAVAIATLVAADVETINLVANTGTGLTSITTLAHDDWSVLNISGASDVSITSTATAALINSAVNASTATGDVTLDFALTTTNGVSLTTGAGDDTITGSAQADNITAGAGDDVITGGTGADILAGGAGDDIFVSVAADTATDGAGVGVDVISGFAIGDILRFAAANDVADAGGTAVATASVVVSAGGLATFAAADDTLAEKITTLVADGAIAANEVVFFVQSGNTYVYGAGATADGSDDFMIKLTGVTSFTTLTESTTTAGDFTFA